MVKPRQLVQSCSRLFSGSPVLTSGQMPIYHDCTYVRVNDTLQMNRGSIRRCDIISRGPRFYTRHKKKQRKHCSNNGEGGGQRHQHHTGEEADIGMQMNKETMNEMEAPNALNFAWSALVVNPPWHPMP